MTLLSKADAASAVEAMAFALPWSCTASTEDAWIVGAPISSPQLLLDSV